MIQHPTDEVIQSLQSRYHSAKPCSAADVATLEQQHGVQLPEVYRQFLFHFGRGLEGYETGTDFTLNWLPGMKPAADRMLAAEGFQTLAENAFVFWMHQGYQFCFFMCSAEHEDPEVWYFNECAPQIGLVKVADTLSHFLMNPGTMNPVLDALMS